MSPAATLHDVTLPDDADKEDDDEEEGGESEISFEPDDAESAGGSALLVPEGTSVGAVARASIVNTVFR